MATNIIERLVLELGVDLSKFAAEADKAIQKNDKLESALGDSETAAKKAGTAHTKLAKGHSQASKDMTSFVKTIQSGVKWFATFSGALLGATGLLKLANDTAKANMLLSNLSRNLSMATTDLNAWQNIAGAASGSADGMASSLNSLKQGMNSLVMFGDVSMLPYFNALGVAIVDSNGKVRGMSDVMLDLADAFEKMPKDQAYTLAKQMSLDDSTINTLMLGRKELQSMLDVQKKMYQSDAKAIGNSRELSKQQMILNSQWQSMKKMIGDALTPILISLTKTVNAFFEFLQKNRNTIKHVFQAAAIFIGLALIPLLKTALVALVAFIAPFAPFILTVTALGAAFIALYDDYKTWAEGGKSLFNWSAFKNLIDSNILSVDSLKEAFKGLGNEMLNYVLPSIRDFMDIIMKLKNGDIKGAWTSLVSLSTRPAEALLNIGQYAVGGVAKVLDAAAGVDSASDESLAYKINSAPRIGTTLRNKVIQGAGGTAADMDNASRKGGQVLSISNAPKIKQGVSAKKAEFIQKYWPAAKRIAEKMSVPIESVLAQFALETNWGKSIISGTNNLGNIKAGGGWKGATKRAYDKREKSFDPYRVYKNVEEFADDYIKVVGQSKRYKNVIGSKNSHQFFSRLKAAGYATDPNYVKSGVATANGVSAALDNTAQYQIQRNAQRAQQALTQQRQLQSLQNSVHNNNSKQVDVNIQNINVQTSSNTISGNVLDAVKSAKNYLWNQLGTSLS